MPNLAGNPEKVWNAGEKAGKRLTWSHLPIPVQHQGEPAELNEGNNESQTGNNFIGEKKRNSHLLPEPVEQPRQAPVSQPPVAGAGPGLTVWKQAGRRESCTVIASPSDEFTGEATIGGPQPGISVFGVSQCGLTHLRTLELIGRIGRKS